MPGADLVADQDVVVVTLAYRLNAFGFLSYEDSMIPGNAGLHDQYLAILWVSVNLKKDSKGCNLIYFLIRFTRTLMLSGVTGLKSH